jgi:hypothetical protein
MFYFYEIGTIMLDIRGELGKRSPVIHENT